MNAEEVRLQKPWTGSLVEASAIGSKAHLQWIGLLFVFLLALVTRLPFFWGVSYPLNDGGMFAQIVDELRANHFLLPRETSYNFAHIPLCYPPLGFYLGALAGALLHQTTTTVLVWMPLLFNFATVVAFYFLALELLGTHYLATCASVIYASLTRSSEWLIMGGGLTRSPGEFFAVLSFLFFVKATKRRQISWAILAGAAAGLACLAHLEAAVLSAVSLVVLALFLPGLPRNLYLLCIAGAISLVLVLPWAVWSLAVHGTGPYSAAMHTHGSSLNVLHDKTLIVALALGLVLAYFRQPPFLIWLFANMFFVPRSGPTHSTIMYGLFGAWLIGIVVEWVGRWTKVSKQRIAVAITALFCVLWTAKSVQSLRWYLTRGNRLEELIVNSRAALSTEDVDGMRWARENTSPDARFFVFNQRISPWDHDLRGEWFPYIAQRRSVYTVQGTEWLPDGVYQAGEERTATFNEIKSEPDLVKVIEPRDFDYIFLAGPYDRVRARCADLIRSLPNIKLVYKTSNIEIWQRSAPGLQ